MLPIAIVAYLVLFISVGVLFLFASLLLGRFLRPHAPSVTKGESYECGEPAVGSGFLQFDLRFYVVALLFIIFEVELAFFFPPAVVFGKVNQLRGYFKQSSQEQLAENKSEIQLTPAMKAKFGELTIPPASVGTTSADAAKKIESDLSDLSLMALLDIGVFFVVLLVGFAYLWKRGDLNWVRAVSPPDGQQKIRLAALPPSGETP